MAWRSPRSLRQKLLLLLIVIATLPVALIAVLTQPVATHGLDSAVGALQVRAARAEAERVGSYLNAFAAALDGALTHERPARLSFAEEQAFLTRLFLSDDAVSQLSLLRDGEMVASAFVDDPAAFTQRDARYAHHPSIDLEQLRRFSERVASLVAGGGIELSPRRFASSVYPSPTGPRIALLVVSETSDARGADHPDTLLAAELSLAPIAERLALGYEPGTRVFIVDDEKKVVLAAPPLEEGVGVAPLTFIPHEGHRGTLELSGESFEAAFHPVAKLPLEAIVARPTAQAKAPLRAFWAVSAGALVLALLLAYALSRRASRTLAEPIAELLAGARAFSQGALDHRIDLRRDDELGDLARAFDQMGSNLLGARQRLLGFNEALQAEVEARTSELRHAQQQLLRSQRLSALGDLAAGLAHEVNNPLTAVIGNAQLLALDLPHDDANRQRLDDLVAEALRISDIVTDLRALAEAERGTRGPVELSRLLDRALSQHETTLDAVGARVERRFEAAIDPVLGDGPALETLFGHLLANAAQAITDRPRRDITVSTSRLEEGAVRVELADTGCGIPAEHLDRIFNPFFTTKQQWAGRGLSLSICHRIAESHGGRITVQSEEGIGTRVSLVLPAAPAQPHLR